ncbi:hypothetical protein GCM10008174_31230 [Methylopila turkensis]|uniref:Uncharacterized protein n=1 Tax=Methylopila turkensis TaxID=1437816 RepID=A0A9W6JQE5_9HYPH|nr:hypothetical protein GCM10008174_31230 [Methylopila turkensis]
MTGSTSVRAPESVAHFGSPADGGRSAAAEATTAPFGEPSSSRGSGPAREIAIEAASGGQGLMLWISRARRGLAS